MAAKKAKIEIEINPLVKELFEEIDNRNSSVLLFSKESGIPSARVYKWKQEGTTPKEDDAKEIRKWLKGEKSPNEEDIIKMNKEFTKVIGELEERLLRAEAHLEVFENAIAGLQAESKSDFPKKVGELRREVQAAVNRLFDGLKKKLS